MFHFGKNSMLMLSCYNTKNVHLKYCLKSNIQHYNMGTKINNFHCTYTIKSISSNKQDSQCYTLVKTQC